MKKIFLPLLVTVLSLTLLIPGATVLADTSTDSNAKSVLQPALGIRAPQIIEVNQSFTMQVVEKHSRKPESKVAVYAVKTEALNQALTASNKSDFNALVDKYATSAKEIGMLLGTTDDNGQLTYIFKELQKYILIAVKDGFVPGFARINIILAIQKALNISAPNMAEAGQLVTITVTERPVFKPIIGLPKVVNPDQAQQAAKPSTSTQVVPPMQMQEAKSLPVQAQLVIRQIPVPKANVYAVKANSAEGIDSVIIQGDDKGNSAAGKYATLAKEKGIFIGATDEKGQVQYSFKETGRYILVALKDTYTPGFTHISIIPVGQKALHISAPAIAEVNQPVTITVSEKGLVPAVPTPTPTTSSSIQLVLPRRFVPVANASVYAIKITDIDPINEILKKAGGDENSAVEKYTAVAKEKGTLLGTTDDNGQLITKFADTGKFVLLAIKDGYRPGFTRIGIVLKGQKKLQISAPTIAEVGQQVLISVGEANFPFPISPPVALPAPIPGSTATPNPSPPTATQPLSLARYAPVANANIYAVKVNVADAINNFLSEAFENNTAVIDKYTTIARQTGKFLGTTNEKGQLFYAFPEVGKYILVAIKDGYRPGFTRIAIVLTTEKKALNLESPEAAFIGQPVTLLVTERVRITVPQSQSGQSPSISNTGPASVTQATQIVIAQPASIKELPVPNASIYAVRFKDYETLPESLTNTDGTPSITAEKYIPLAKNWFIGTTDVNGQLTTKFADTGRYVLVALKDGYLPGFDKLRIDQPKPITSQPSTTATQ